MDKQNLVLRDYQQECLDAINAAGDGHWLIVMATGLGKTATFTRLSGSGRTLILSHRDELVRQPEEYYPDGVTFGVEKAEEKATDEQIISASVQSMAKDNRLSRYAPDAFDTIIVDESHHVIAPTYRKILDHFSGVRRTLGFTATPQRGDGEGLAEVFDEIIFSRDLKWGIVNGYLSRIRCEEVTADYDINRVKRLAGDLSGKDLERALFQSQAIGTTAKVYVEHCHYKGRHTLIYCVTKAVAGTVSGTIKGLLREEEADTIAVLTGETPDDERASILKNFSEGKIKCIINCMVLTEGTDLPICDTVINLRPTCNPGLYQQMAGRCVRLYPGKEYALIIDILPEEDKKGSLISAPSLFGVKQTDLEEEEKKELNENTDLLSFCEEISEVCLAAAQSVEIKVKMIDLFVDEMMTAINETKETGIYALAKRLIRQLEKENKIPDYIDAKGLVVTTQAGVDSRYKIKPSWNETITISEPDVLQNCNISICVLNDPYNDKSGGVEYAGKMKVDEAFDVACRFCSKLRHEFGYIWNATQRNSWGKKEATDKQKSKISIDYNRYDMDEEGIDHLTKLEASILIDDAARLKRADIDREEVLNDTGGNNLPKRDISELKDVLYVNHDTKGGTLTVPLNIMGAPWRSASKKQIDYIEGMLEELCAGGDDAGDIDIKSISMRQASGLIEILKAMLNGERGDRVFKGVKDKLDAFELSSPGEIKIEYTYR